MKKIGILSDTHAWWDERYAVYLGECDEIWHAGDIGSIQVAERLEAIKPLRAVRGNVDGTDLQQRYARLEHFTVEDRRVMMTHIGGYPGHYDLSVRNELFRTKPDIFITGHSHILKVMFDPHLQCLCINPGAAGRYGIHKVRTLVRTVIDGDRIRDLEIIELKD
ncbi:MAG: metallophosphatase family protein [Tannerella sp.]|jgi:putative phosphoesterase|nr:metallophosphatase family protein [Tannerella sp.]